MASKNLKIQSLVFDKKTYSSKRKVNDWVKKNNFKIDNRLKNPIMKFDKTFRVRQRNPDWFRKDTFRTVSLGKGVKGVYGFLKQK